MTNTLEGGEVKELHYRRLGHQIAGPDQLYANPQHPYTRLLLSSIPGR